MNETQRNFVITKNEQLIFCLFKLSNIRSELFVIPKFELQIIEIRLEVLHNPLFHAREFAARLL